MSFSVFDQWAREWGFPAEAVADLVARLTVAEGGVGGASESAVQSEIRLIASRRGDMALWRNNSGALEDKQGRPVRFGLGNDSAVANKRMKSADLIGLQRVVIGPEHVGQTFGRFVSIEVKRPGWKPSARDERDQAQANWAATVAAFGGVALRTSDPQTVKELK